LEIVAQAVFDTDMILPVKLEKATEGFPGSPRNPVRGRVGSDFGVFLRAKLSAGGKAEVNLPFTLSRVYLRSKVRLLLHLNGEAPYMSVLDVSFIDLPEMDLRLKIGPVSVPWADPTRDHVLSCRAC
jgi:hypothetical protein